MRPFSMVVIVGKEWNKDLDRGRLPWVYNVIHMHTHIT